MVLQHVPDAWRSMPKPSYSLGEQKPQLYVQHPELSKGVYRVDPLVVFKHGRRRRGKTVSMVADALRLHHTYERFARGGWKVESNFFMDFADCTPYLIDELRQDPMQHTRKMVYLDEVSGIAPSRRSSAGVNVDLAHMLEQIRKLESEVQFTAQRLTAIDRAVLWQTDLFVLCDAHVHPLSIVNPVLAAQAYVDLYVVDYWGNFTGDERERPWPPRIWDADKRMRINRLDLVWGHYHTREFIPSMHSGGENKKEYRERVIRAQWEVEGDDTPEDRATPAARKRTVEEEHTAEEEYEQRQFDAQMEADLAQAKKEGKLPPVSAVFNMAPQTMEEYMSRKALGGRFYITRGIVGEMSALDPSIRKFEDVRKRLEEAGFSIKGSGKHIYAEAPGR